MFSQSSCEKEWENPFFSMTVCAETFFIFIFWASLVNILGPKKSWFPGPTPSNAPCNGTCPHQNHYVPRHLYNKYIIKCSCIGPPRPAKEGNRNPLKYTTPWVPNLRVSKSSLRPPPLLFGTTHAILVQLHKHSIMYYLFAYLHLPGLWQCPLGPHPWPLLQIGTSHILPVHPPMQQAQLKGQSHKIRSTWKWYVWTCLNWSAEIDKNIYKISMILKYG